MAARVGGLAGSLVVVLLAALLGAPLPEAAGDPSPGTSRRIGDSTDVVQAAIDISQETFADGEAEAVVLSRDDLFADSLAGSALAGARPGPILYTAGGDSAALDEATAAEIERVLTPEGCVFVLGGTTAVSDGAVGDLHGMGYCAQRIGGANRLETASAIAGVVDNIIGESPTVLVARADEWADALTGGAYAAAFGVPLVLNPSDSSSAELFDYLDSRSTVANVVLLGGIAALSDDVAADIEGAGYGLRRVAGATRTDTAVAIAEELWGDSGQTGVTLVNGFVPNGWAYALAAAVTAAREGAPELYVGNELPQATDDYLDSLTTCEFAITAGPTSLISESFAERADEACGGDPGSGPSPSARPTASPSPSASSTETPDNAFPVFLFDERSVEDEGRWFTDSVDINGQNYPKTVYADGVDTCCFKEGDVFTIDYDLGRDYERFNSTIGLSDTSSDGTRWQFDVFVDGTNVASHALGLGESVPVSIDVTGALRLRLAVTNLATEGGAIGAFGDAALDVDPE